MRRATRYGQPLLAAASTPQCACAPATLPIAAHRALSTTSTLQITRDRIRKALWKGKAPGPEDPYAAENLQLSKQEQIEADIEEANAQLAEFESSFEKRVIPTQPRKPQRLRAYSKLQIKNQQTTAPSEKEAEEGDKTYTPAKDSTGLETIGGVEGWWEQEGRWGEESQLPAVSRPKIENKYVCEVLARAAIAEVLFVMRMDRALVAGKWNPLTPKGMKRAFHFDIQVSADGTGRLIGGGEEDQKVMLKKLIDPKHAPQQQEVVSLEEARRLIKTWDNGWKRISLRDPVISFAFHKRFSQLTGHRFHDAKVLRLGNIGSFLDEIAKPPKPANVKVAEAIQQAGSLPALANVALHERRVTPIDKETALGRWKVIKKELENRNLPVTGHEHLPRPVQRKWILGKP